MKILLSFSLLIFSALPCLALPVLDFDGDGQTDLVTAVASDNQLSWTAKNFNTDEETLSDILLGSSTDIATPGFWSSSESPELGSVRVDSTNNRLLWRISASDGVSLRQFAFGEPGDLIISGADFDGNGITDACVVRENGSKLLWQVRFNPFSSNRSSRSFRFGIPGDRVFVSSPNGRRDMLGIVGKIGSRGRISWLDTKSNRVRRTTKLSSRITETLITAPRPRPEPVGLSNQTSGVYFATDDGTDTKITVLDNAGRFVTSKTLPGTGTFLAGEFSADENGQEIIFILNTSNVLFNPSTDSIENIESLSVSSPLPLVRFVATEAAQEATPTPSPSESPSATPTPTE